MSESSLPVVSVVPPSNQPRSAVWGNQQADILKRATHPSDIPIGRSLSNYNTLLGRVLTIIDAALTNPVQLKAAKDLVRREFREAQDADVNGRVLITAAE